MSILARFLLAALIACPGLCCAQLTPQFQFVLHFEDSIGNRDSIIIGLDSSASLNDIDPQFGEVVLTKPFDSVLEVRAVHFNDSAERAVKVLIERTGTLNCVTELGALLFIHAKFPPIKISYDSTMFPINTCGNVILSPEWNIFLLPEWWDAYEYHCMAGTSMFVEDFLHPIGWNWLFVEKEVEGQGLKQLPGLFLATFYGPGPCNDTTFLSAEDAYGLGIQPLSPNPVNEHFSIKVPPGAEVQAMVSDVAGRSLVCPFTLCEGVVEFDASHLSPGLYFITLQVGHKRQQAYRFVKM